MNNYPMRDGRRFVNFSNNLEITNFKQHAIGLF